MFLKDNVLFGKFYTQGWWPHLGLLVDYDRKKKVSDISSIMSTGQTES